MSSVSVNQSVLVALAAKQKLAVTCAPGAWAVLEVMSGLSDVEGQQISVEGTKEFSWPQPGTVKVAAFIKPCDYTIGGGLGESLLSSDFVLCADPKFGGFWDGVRDDGPAIALAAAHAASFSPRKHIVLPPLVGAGSSVYIPMDVYVLGSNYLPGKVVGTKIIPIVGASFANGYFLGMNTTDALGSVEVPNAWNIGANCGLGGVFFDNTPNDIAGARLCVFAGRGHFEDLWGFYAVQMLKQAANVYSDNLFVDRVKCHRSLDNSEYAIHIGNSGTGGGDSGYLANLYFSPSELSGGPEKSVYIKSSNCASIRNMINGVISLNGCTQVSIDNWHSEAAQLLVDKSSFSLSNSTLEMKDGATYYPIDLAQTADTVFAGVVSLNNVNFKYGLSGREGNPPAELRTTRNYTVHMTNVHRSIHSANNTARIGVRVNTDADVPIDTWNRNSGFLSTQGMIAAHKPVGVYDAHMPTADFLGVYSAVTKVTGFGSSTFVNSTTYFYKAQLLLDTQKMVGLTQSGELSVTMSATSATSERNFAPVGWGTCPAFATLRVYRGTASGSYDAYCDIPSAHCRSIQDIGDYVNGLPWIARSAGPVDAITSLLGSYQITPGLGAMLTTPYENNPNLGDANATIGSPVSMESTAVVAAALTASRDYQINSTITALGSRVHLTRNNAASGAFNAVFKDPAGTTLKTLATNNTWATAELCFGNVWRLVASGTL